jgi:hypothetical protein
LHELEFCGRTSELFALIFLFDVDVDMIRIEPASQTKDDVPSGTAIDSKVTLLAETPSVSVTAPPTLHAS